MTALKVIRDWATLYGTDILGWRRGCFGTVVWGLLGRHRKNDRILLCFAKMVGRRRSLVDPSRGVPLATPTHSNNIRISLGWIYGFLWPTYCICPFMIFKKFFQMNYSHGHIEVKGEKHKEEHCQLRLLTVRYHPRSAWMEMINMFGINVGAVQDCLHLII